VSTATAWACRVTTDTLGGLAAGGDAWGAQAASSITVAAASLPNRPRSQRSSTGRSVTYAPRQRRTMCRSNHGCLPASYCTCGRHALTPGRPPSPGSERALLWCRSTTPSGRLRSQLDRDAKEYYLGSLLKGAIA